jgi:hypothetical protein
VPGKSESAHCFRHASQKRNPAAAPPKCVVAWRNSRRQAWGEGSGSIFRVNRIAECFIACVRDGSQKGNGSATGSLLNDRLDGVETPGQRGIRRSDEAPPTGLRDVDVVWDQHLLPCVEGGESRVGGFEQNESNDRIAGRLLEINDERVGDGQLQAVRDDMHGREGNFVGGVGGSSYDSTMQPVDKRGSSGNYSLGFVPGSTFTVTPSLNGFMFVPGLRSYTNVTGSVSNENYLVVTTIAPSLEGGLSGTNLQMNWFGIPGVTYQLYSSTNLTDWLPYDTPIPGSNGVVEIPLPIESDPMKFFKVSAKN